MYIYFTTHPPVRLCYVSLVDTITNEFCVALCVERRLLPPPPLLQVDPESFEFNAREGFVVSNHIEDIAGYFKCQARSLVDDFTEEFTIVSQFVGMPAIFRCCCCCCCCC